MRCTKREWLAKGRVDDEGPSDPVTSSVKPIMPAWVYVLDFRRRLPRLASKHVLRAHRVPQPRQGPCFSPAPSLVAQPSCPCFLPRPCWPLRGGSCVPGSVSSVLSSCWPGASSWWLG